MAVDDEMFYNILGEEISRENIVNEMIKFYTLLREVGDTIVSDFNEGSEIRNILEAIAVVCYWILENDNENTKTAFVSTAEGELLDMHGDNPWIRQPRDVGSEATGYVTFKIPEASTEDIIIPEDTTVICEETGNDYFTDHETLIPVGETEAVASVTCATEGEDGNVGTNEITLIDDDYLDIPELTVTNEEQLTGGTDYEEDEEYRERLLAYIRRDDFGSLPYYQELAESVDGVHDAVFLDDPVYTKKILVNGTVKPTPETVLSEVLEEFTNLNNIVVGHTFSVRVPEYVPVKLSVDLTVEELIDETELTSIMQDLFNGGDSVLGYEFDGLGIGETLFASTVSSVFETYDGVLSVNVNRIIEGTSAPLEDITVSSDECIKLQSVVFNQTIGE